MNQSMAADGAAANTMPLDQYGQVACTLASKMFQSIIPAIDANYQEII
jgi:hypothetical protein